MADDHRGRRVIDCAHVTVEYEPVRLNLEQKHAVLLVPFPAPDDPDAESTLLVGSLDDIRATLDAALRLVDELASDEDADTVARPLKAAPPAYADQPCRREACGHPLSVHGPDGCTRCGPRHCPVYKDRPALEHVECDEQASIHTRGDHERRHTSTARKA